jgi:polyhydroxyalkanoate synthesis regulator protein
LGDVLGANTEEALINYIRYPNHRLYDIESSGYVIFPDIYSKIAAGKSIQVTERRSGKDGTHEVLMGIIVHICFKSEAIFTENFLRFLILASQNPSKIVIQQYFELIFSAFDNLTTRSGPAFVPDIDS